MQSRELVKLYYRIGEVSDIVGVQPHVLRYWETEFRSIRPQKSSKGQRVYSRRDVEKLLRVKDLLKNQGFTIAGARKRLSEPAPAPAPAPEAQEAVRVVQAVEAAQAVAAVEPDPGAKAMRKVLLGLRQDLMRMLDEIAVPKER
jgi:DNA-binding transcriptional MerR regulator